MRAEKNTYYLDLYEKDFQDKIQHSDAGLNAVIFNNEQFATNLIYDDILKAVADELCNSCHFYRVNSDSSIALKDRLGIRNIPILLLYNNGEIVGNLIGIYPKGYLKNYLSEFL